MHIWGASELVQLFRSSLVTSSFLPAVVRFEIETPGDAHNARSDIDNYC
jgi:hypothetical protein